ncbi:hypothetical protein [Thauera sp. Sel9]|uniref:hypothetical protein n=1 Tax=Thauera sp. Sel9 TaxID=2974299 RepID=UPI0021E17E1D|nr:hypothetical protein [Thauera sp. Sel9]MCV2218892.1 hypothetical protein [Thauera sp. Sel9]
MTKITTEAVLTAITDYRGEIDTDGRTVFSTSDIARVMGCDEYRVRVACSWLRRQRIIEAIEGSAVIRRTARTGERYTANLYRLKPQARAEAFDALFQTFGLGGEGSRTA